MREQRQAQVCVHRLVVPHRPRGVGVEGAGVAERCADGWAHRQAAAVHGAADKRIERRIKESSLHLFERLDPLLQLCRFVRMQIRRLLRLLCRQLRFARLRRDRRGDGREEHHDRGGCRDGTKPDGRTSEDGCGPHDRQRDTDPRERHHRIDDGELLDAEMEHAGADVDGDG